MRIFKLSLVLLLTSLILQEINAQTFEESTIRDCYSTGISIMEKIKNNEVTSLNQFYKKRELENITRFLNNKEKKLHTDIYYDFVNERFCFIAYKGTWIDNGTQWGLYKYDFISIFALSQENFNLIEVENIFKDQERKKIWWQTLMDSYKNKKNLRKEWSELYGLVPPPPPPPEDTTWLKKVNNTQWDKYLINKESKIKSDYHFILSKNKNREYIRRAFYPEKDQITSFETFKSKDFLIKNGACIYWFDNGHKSSEGYYRNNIKDGYWKYYTHKNKTIRFEGKYVNGKTHGLWKNYDHKGRLELEVLWVEGVKEGPFTHYDTLGEILNKGIYKADTIFQQNNNLQRKRFESSGVAFSVADTMPYLKEVEHINDIADRKKKSDQALLNFIYKNIKYPEFARLKEVEGLFLVSFIIDENGDISNITVLHGICQSIEEEALELMKDMPKWNPGILEGKEVRIKYNLPIRFKLN